MKKIRNLIMLTSLVFCVKTKCNGHTMSGLLRENITLRAELKKSGRNNNLIKSAFIQIWDVTKKHISSWYAYLTAVFVYLYHSGNGKKLTVSFVKTILDAFTDWSKGPSGPSGGQNNGPYDNNSFFLNNNNNNSDNSDNDGGDISEIDV